MKLFSLFVIAIAIGMQTASAQNWSTTGNSGLTSSNYIGTNDAASFIIKVNKYKSGYIDYLNSNTSFGYQSLLNVSAPVRQSGNTAFGYQSLYTNTTGNYNTATGQNAMYLNLTGASNVAYGVRALYSNTTASFNTAIGNRALYLTTTGGNNTAIGNRALYNNTAGYSNVAIGVDALNANDVSNLVAVGDSALYNNHTDFDYGGGNGNTGVGSKALFTNYAGAFNTAVGDHSLYRNSYGSQNTAIGYYALYNQNDIPAYSADWVTGNVAIGYQTLYKTTGSESAVYNTATGNNALYNNTEGGENAAYGLYSLYTNLDGYGNTGIGYGADVQSGSLYNATAIGYGAIVNASNKVRIGNTGVTSIGGQVGWSVFSDGRYKKNIKENVAGLAFINRLKPITYTIDVDGLDTYFSKGRKTDPKAKTTNRAKNTEAAKAVYSGFIAQDVEAAAAGLNYTFSGVDKPVSKDGLYGLRYDNFVVPLVKAVQELSAQNDTLKSINQNLEQRIARLEAIMETGKTGASALQPVVLVANDAALEQNVPNPFRGTTVIRYQLPQKYTTAQIRITDLQGKTIKVISAENNNRVLIDASALAGGTYAYSLVVDGKTLGTKEMVVGK